MGKRFFLRFFRASLWPEVMVGAILVLNLLDGIFTLIWVQAGLVEEKNFLLKDLVNSQPLLFVTIKISLVSFGSYLLWIQRKHRVAAASIVAAFLLYYMVLLYHLQFTSVMISRLFG